MPTANVVSDTGRLSQLKLLGILSGPAEDHFDALAELAASALRAPVALINFIDDAHTWCKALGAHCAKNDRTANAYARLRLSQKTCSQYRTLQFTRIFLAIPT